MTDPSGDPVALVPPSTRSHPGTAGLLLAFLVLLGSSLLINALMVERLPGLTPIDGWVYADAFDRAGQGAATVEGDRIGQSTLEQVACEGVYAFGALGLECGGNLTAEVLPRQGWTTAYVHPPTYFFLTVGVASGLTNIWGIDQFTAGRLVSSLWFALGGLVVVLLAMRWGARLWPSVLVLVALIPTPTFVSLFGFITPDSMSLLVCGGILWATTCWWQRSIPPVALLPVAAMAGTVKQTFLLAVLAAVLLVIGLWFWRRERSGREMLQAVALLCGGALLGVVGWELAKRSMSLAPFPDFGPDPFAYPLDFNGFFGLPFVGAWGLPAEAAGDALPLPLAAKAVGAAMALALAAAAGGAVLYQRWSRDTTILAAVAILSIALGSLPLSVAYVVSNGIFLPPAPRYVIGAFPLYVVPLMLLAERRSVQIFLAVAAGVGAVSWFVFPTQSLV